MKFLCPNCKAKYQISDEKISGRTLKMDCRRCNHPIVIRGDQQRRAAARPSTGNSVQRRGGSHVGPSPSRSSSSRGALGADFRKQSLPPQSSRPTALDQWHVAINDVPVGPMKRDEVLKKIQAGAIKPESLAWREGFDDWRPLRDIPELAALLRKKAPPPANPSFPPPARGMPSSSRPRPAARPQPRRTSSAPSAPSVRPDAARPAARGNVVPIGGRLGAAAAPALEELGDFLEDDEPTRVGTAIDFEALENEAKVQRDRESGASLAPVAPPAPAPIPDPFGAASPPSSAPAAAAAPLTPAPTDSSPGALGAPAGLAPTAPIDPFASPPAAAPATPAPAAAIAYSEPPARRRRGLPIGAWIAIAGAMAFGVALAVIVGQSMLAQPAQVVAAPTPAPEPDGPVEAVPELDLEAPEPTADTEAAAGEGEGEAEGDTEGETEGAATGRSGGRTGGTTSTGSSSSAGSAANSGSTSTSGRSGSTAPVSGALARAMADRESGGGAIAPISPRNTGVLDTQERTGGGTLSGDQIRAVVARERSGVQRCYETAARASGQAPRVRLDVNVTIGSSGTVQRADVDGTAFGDLSTCVRRVILRWRFPRSGDTTQTRIPFVFAGRED